VRHELLHPHLPPWHGRPAYGHECGYALPLECLVNEVHQKAVIELLLSAAQEGCEGIYDKASRPQAVEGSQEGLDIRTHPSPLQRLEVDELHFLLLLESFKVHAEPEHVSLQAAYVLLERREDGRFPQPLRRVVDELGGEDRLAR